MAHLRSDTLVTIPRSELGLGPLAELEIGMALIRGDVQVSGGKTHHFHLQVTAASNLSSTPDSRLFFKNFLDTDLLDDLIKAQSPDTIMMVICAVGEVAGDRSMTPPAGPRDMTKSWVDLTKDPNNLEFGDSRRAWVNLVMNSDDAMVGLAMNNAAIGLAKSIANNPATVVVHSQRDAAIGSRSSRGRNPFHGKSRQLGDGQRRTVSPHQQRLCGRPGFVHPHRLCQSIADSHGAGSEHGPGHRELLIVLSSQRCVEPSFERSEHKRRRACRCGTKLIGMVASSNDAIQRNSRHKSPEFRPATSLRRAPTTP